MLDLLPRDLEPAEHGPLYNVSECALPCPTWNSFCGPIFRCLSTFSCQLRLLNCVIHLWTLTMSNVGVSWIIDLLPGNHTPFFLLQIQWGPRMLIQVDVCVVTSPNEHYIAAKYIFVTVALSPFKKIERNFSFILNQFFRNFEHVIIKIYQQLILFLLTKKLIFFHSW